jgi:DNA-binding transcriptional regulator YhcF (GntR family)
MFVSTGARTQLLERRREEFAKDYIAPLLAQARKLGMDAEQIKKMIDVWGDDQ